MKRAWTLSEILLLATAALGGVSVLSCVFAPWLLAVNWLARGGVALGMLTITATTVALYLGRRWRHDQLAHASFDELSRCDTAALSDASFTLSLPDNHSWQPIFLRLRSQLVEQAQRLMDAEHARARAEIRSQRLLAERKQIADILSNLQDPVLAIDQYDELVLANPSAEQLLRFSTKTSESRALESLVQCEQLVELLRETRRRKSPATRTSELVLTDREGQEHSYRVTCRSLAADGHEGDRHSPHGAVAVLSDIGQIKAIQKRNAEFVSSVSHEMKAPLSGIRAYVELLADGEAEDEATRDEFLSVIGTQAERLQRLVENLLNIARIEAGVVDVHKAARSLNELMEEALHVVQPAAEAKDIELASELSPMYLEVFADRDMLLQSAINLLSNAVKYTPAGGRVTLRTRMEDHQAWFEVEDTGVGLSPEDQLRVFEKFYRVKKDSQMAPGTGLGLALAKHIIEDVHGGSLVVESELGQGSTFRAVLPTAGRMAVANA